MEYKNLRKLAEELMNAIQSDDGYVEAYPDLDYMERNQNWYMLYLSLNRFINEEF